jgi:hypothetical protein
MPLPAVELIANEIAPEVMEVIGMYTQNGGRCETSPPSHLWVVEID